MHSGDNNAERHNENAEKSDFSNILDLIIKKRLQNYNHN